MICAPRAQWVFMTSYSAGVKGPGLFKISSGMEIFPTSCSAEALTISADRAAVRG